MLPLRLIALLAALAALALPATALAQSAGDNQYQDPLAGQHSGKKHSSSSQSSGSSSSSSSTGTGSFSRAAQTTPAQSSATSAQATGKQLPRTGFELLVPIELGLAMLLAGVTLRRVVTLRSDDR